MADGIKQIATLWLDRARCIPQRPKDKHKLYALEVECIGGPARQPYKFGVKVDITTEERLIVGARAFPAPSTACREPDRTNTITGR